MHSERTRPCSQIDPPPHSLHLSRRRPCGQALHTLHCERYLTPCSHGPFVVGALFRFAPFPSEGVVPSSPFIPSSSAGGSTLTSGTSSSGTSSLTGMIGLINQCGRQMVVMVCDNISAGRRVVPLEVGGRPEKTSKSRSREPAKPSRRLAHIRDNLAFH